MATATLRESPALLPVFAQWPVEPVRGEGVWLETRDGRRLLDLYAGHAVALLGYGHPRLLAALRAQAETLFFQTTAAPLAVRARAAEALARFAPRGLGHVFFVNSGAEANENALRLACRATGRRKIVAVEGAFHGRTAAAAAVTAGAERWYGFPRAPFEVEFVPRRATTALAAALEGAAALILEPVQGMAGAVDLGSEFLAAARDLTRRKGTVLIFDEVQCGMGRTGWPFAAQMHGMTPDLMTVAKGLAGGFPAGALLASDDLAAVVRPGDLGTTFGGGPLACALVAATIAAIEEQGLLSHAQAMSARIRERCAVGPVEGIQGAGLLLGLRTRRPAKEVLDELLARGVLAGASADPHVVRLLPPLVLEDEHVDRLAAALEEISK